MGLTTSVTQIGWDAHRKFSQVTLRDQELKVVARRRIEHEDRKALREILASWPTNTPVVLEATFGWPWIADELLEAKLRPRLANSNRLAAWRKSRGLAKSNRLDADLLSELPSEKQAWWEVWLPPQPVRELRELLRHRMALVRLQTGLKNRIHALLHRRGILHEHADLFGAAGRSFLQLLVLRKDERLSVNARLALKDHLQLLDHLRRRIATATRAFRRFAQADAIARRLKTLPGVAWILAYTMRAEIGLIERFCSSRRLASYSMLAPLADDTGEPVDGPPQGRHIGTAGRRTLSWAFLEAARSAIRKDANLRAVFNRITDDGRRNRNRGYVAVARRLCVLVYALWKHEQDYSPTPPPRPGRERRRKRRSVKSTTSSSRPGTGQPDVAMVPAAAASSPQASM